jgi:ABC-type glycerol-3-phosphate transport system substrate-binding protein
MFHFHSRQGTARAGQGLVLALASALVVASLLLACTPAAPAPAGGAQPAQKVKVLYWGHDFAPRVTLDKKYAEEFMKENPDIEVTVEAIPNYDEKLRTALAAGTGPDMFSQWNGEIGQFYLSGAIVPVDPVAMGFNEQSEAVNQYASPDAILAGAMFEGKLYGIPNEVSTYGCFLNKALWAEAGLDAEKDFPAYWEDFPAVMEKMTKRDASGNIAQRGFDFLWGTPDFKFEFLVSLMQQLGVQPIDEVAYTARFDTPEAEQALQYMVDWVNKYNLGGPAYQVSRDAFLAGTLATECTYGSWGISGMKDAKIDFAVHKVPTFREAKNKNHFDTYAYFQMVNARSAPEVQRAAWKFISFLSQHPEEYLPELVARGFGELFKLVVPVGLGVEKGIIIIRF